METKTLKVLKHINPKKYGLSNWCILEGKEFPRDKQIMGKFEWRLIEYTLDEISVDGAKNICPQDWELGKIDHLHSINPKILLKEREKDEKLEFADIMALGTTEREGFMTKYPVLRYRYLQTYTLECGICCRKYPGRRNDFLLIVKKIN